MELVGTMEIADSSGGPGEGPVTNIDEVQMGND